MSDTYLDAEMEAWEKASENDYDPDVTCGICGGQSPNGEHEVHDTPCVIELLQKRDEAKAESAQRLVLLRDLAAWYSDTANAHFRYLPIGLVERLEEELK